jgi:signal transduction histidine kinase
MQRTLDCLLELSVPALGDACVVCLLRDGDTRGEITAVKHADRRREALLTGLAEAAVRESHGWQPILTVASTGRSAVLSRLNTAALLGDGRSVHVLLGDIGVNTSMVIPVCSSERPLAVLIFLSDRTRRYTRAWVRLGEELASRFAMALRAAEMYQECKASLHQTEENLATTMHDVMSPLSYIKAVAQRLRRIENQLCDPGDFSDFRASLEGIDAAVNRTAAALSALAHSARLSTENRATLSHERTELAGLVRRVVIAEQLMARDHSIRIVEAPLMLEGAWDADGVERMLSNLISNAVKYSPPSRSIDVCLSCEIDGEGQWAVLRVIDQGLGIPARDLPFVFEPFRRGSNVGSVSGTGLGLASVWQTVKVHDGRLWVESEEGKGTSVTVSLPLDEKRIVVTSCNSSNAPVGAINGSRPCSGGVHGCSAVLPGLTLFRREKLGRKRPSEGVLRFIRFMHVPFPKQRRVRWAAGGPWSGRSACAAITYGSCPG